MLNQTLRALVMVALFNFAPTLTQIARASSDIWLSFIEGSIATAWYPDGSTAEEGQLIANGGANYRLVCNQKLSSAPFREYLYASSEPGTLYKYIVDSHMYQGPTCDKVLKCIKLKGSHFLGVKLRLNTDDRTVEMADLPEDCEKTVHTE